MNNIIKKFIVLVLLISSFYIVNAAQKYNYVCDNDLCYNTTTDFIENNYYLLPVSTGGLDNNFTSDINERLLEYSNYYDDIEYTIDNFCPEPCDDPGADAYDKITTFSGILNYSSGFSITDGGWFFPEIVETYSSSKNYIFSNFKDIIDTLHDNGGFPVSDKKDELSDILTNILSYSGSNNEFELRNICDNFNCNSSSLKDIVFGDTINFNYINGEISQSDQFTENTFIVSEDYSIVDDLNNNISLTKAGKSVVFSFGFEDYLDFTEDNTEYEYTMFSLLDGDEVPSLTGSELEQYIIDNHGFYLNESILIDNETYDVTSTGLLDLVDDVIHINVENSDTKKIRVGIREPINLIKAGSTVFYLTAKNLTSGEKFDITPINRDFPLIVLPRDEIASIDGEFEDPFNSEGNINSSSGISMEQPIPVTLRLKDTDSDFYNVKTDNIEGYDISFTSGTSEFIEMTVDGNPNTAERTKTLNGVETGIDGLLHFYIRVLKSGYHDFKGFNIKNKYKNDNYSYINPIEENSYNGFIPSNLYDNNGTLYPIFVKAPITTDLVLECGSKVVVEYKCTGDNLSGCNGDIDTKTYTGELDNGKDISFKVRDKAYNWSEYVGILNHIDTTAPKVTSIKKGGSVLFNGNEYNYLANNDQLIVDLYEKTTSSCIKKIYYSVLLNGNNINATNVFNEGVNINPNFSFNGDQYSVLSGEYAELEIKDIFKKSGVYNLEIKLLDQYGNTRKFTIDYNIFPNTELSLNSTISFEGDKNSLYANNFDSYNYKLHLVDSEGNDVYNKNILEIDNDCSSYTDCNQLETMENSGIDPLIEFNNIGYTSTGGIKDFNIRSLVPGNFKGIYKVKLKSWDNSYNDISDILEYEIGDINDINSFKKPIKGSIFITDGTKPIFGKEQKYGIKLNKIENNNLVFDNNGKIIINQNTIIDTTEGHFWNKFNVISDSFTANLSDFIGFSGSIDANDNIMSSINISSFNIPISYKIGGEEVKYYLDDFTLTGCSVSTLGLKVIGTLQGDGKANITGQSDNFSDLYKNKLRSIIRKNAYKLIRNRQSGSIINGVKYVEGDIHISGDLPYETLIVKNGNVIIDGDLNISNKKLGIIVLKDNYSIIYDYLKKGNIYVDYNVENINGIFYADGVFRSAQANGLYYSDSLLNKKLTLNGSLFTRNTIGGAVKANTTYLLPGGKETNNFDLAQVYDLNYVRKVGTSCDGDDYSFLIKYNSSIQLDPPKGFYTK